MLPQVLGTGMPDDKKLVAKLLVASQESLLQTAVRACYKPSAFDSQPFHDSIITTSLLYSYCKITEYD